MGRLFAGFLSFIVSVQLTVGQVAFSVGLNAAQAQTQCGANQQFDPIMGRCLSTAQASQVANATASCSSAGDEAAQKKCYLNAAEAALASAEANGEVKAAGKVSPDMMSMILTMGGLASSVSFLITGGSAKCGPFTTSAIIIAAASSAAMMGEIMAGATYKKKMKEANDALKKINEGSAGTTQTGASSAVMNATNVQEEAFKALIKKEEAVIAAAQTKSKLYTLAMVGYAAATVMAGIEVAKSLIPGIGAAATACAAVPAADQAINNVTFGPDIVMVYQPTQQHLPEGRVNEPAFYASTFVDNYFLHGQRVAYSSYITNSILASTSSVPDLVSAMVNQQALRSGHTQTLSLSEFDAIRSQLPDGNIEQESFSLLKGFVLAKDVLIPRAHANPLMMAGGTAATVLLAAKVKAVASGMSFLYTNPYARLALSGVLTANAMATKAKAGKEADKAKERKSFLEKLRDQVAGSSNGGLNCSSADVAQASAACKTTNVEVITPDDATAGSGLASGAYGTNLASQDPILSAPRCVTKTGSFDATCSCKATNNCLSIGSSIAGATPTGVSLGGVGTSLDSITSGKVSAASLEESALTAQAAKLNTLNQNLAKKNPAIAKANENAKKEMAKIGESLGAKASAGPALASSGSSSSNEAMNAQTPEQVLEQLKAEVSQEIGKVEGQAAAASGTPSDLDLSGLGGSTEEATPLNSNDKLAEVMASEYDMGANDINTETTSNIFDIVSNRYKRSGIRRLFGSEAIIPVDNAGSTDINK